MTKVKDHNQSPRRGLIFPGLGQGPLFLLLILLTGFSPAASADADAECVLIQDKLTVEMGRKFKSTDKTGLAERRKNMNNLAQSVSSSCAVDTIDTLLGETDSTLSRLFHNKLAGPTREQLFAILDRRACCATYDDFPEEDIEIDSTQYQVTEGDKECLEIEHELQAQLSRKFKSTDKKGLANRRKNLNELFEATSLSCANTIYQVLVSENYAGLEVQKLFYRKLASATRSELLGILRGKTGRSFFSRVSDGSSN